MSLSKARAIETYSGKSRVRWIIPIGLALVAIALAIFAIREIGLVFTPADESAEAKTVSIEEGLGTNGIADLLVQEDIVQYARSFKLAVLISGSRGNLKAGTFELSAAQTPREIVNVLADGNTKKTKVTIIEGLTIEEAAEVFEEAGLFSSSDFIAAASKQDYDFAFLSSLPVQDNLQGYLFPDTYEFAAGTTAEEVVTKMLDNFGQKIEPLLDQVSASDYSLHELLTLAAIVEGEVPHAEDRPTVAGIFYNRLDNDIPLQADSTVAYITGEDRLDFTDEQLTIEDPYNTYQNTGLPPGPINSPGLSAIEAVLDPSDTAYFYFISDPETRATIFAETLEEHNQNIADYLQ